MAVDQSIGIQMKRTELTKTYDDFKLKKTPWTPWFIPVHKYSSVVRVNTSASITTTLSDIFTTMVSSLP